MTRREIAFLSVGLGLGAIASVLAQPAADPAKLASAGSVIYFASNDLHGMRNAGRTPASYFVLRWTSPGREGPAPGGSR